VSVVVKYTASVSVVLKQCGAQTVWCSSSAVLKQCGAQTVWCSNSVVHKQCGAQAVWCSNSVVHKQCGAQTVRCSNSVVLKQCGAQNKKSTIHLKNNQNTTKSSLASSAKYRSSGSVLLRVNSVQRLEICAEIKLLSEWPV